MAQGRQALQVPPPLQGPGQSPSPASCFVTNLFCGWTDDGCGEGAWETPLGDL